MYDLLDITLAQNCSATQEMVHFFVYKKTELKNKTMLLPFNN